jgi:hypothetical protein
MSTYKEAADNKWFTVYVPAASGGTESYLRIGSPDATTETSFLSALQTAYAGSAAQPAVQAAFGQTSTSGVVMYTTGDLVQFVNGTADMRVLNDRYVVHVLNKATVDAANPATGKATDSTKTYRTYFRLGKPYDIIEGELTGNAADTNLCALVKALLPTPAPTPITDGQAKKDLADDGNADARSYLISKAEAGDREAIDRINDLLSSTNSDVVKRADAQKWARTTLRALHLKVADARKWEALRNTGQGRTKLEAAATGTPKDPVARRKLIEIYEVPTAGVATGGLAPGIGGLTQAQVSDAQTWAKGVLDQLARTSGEMLARWSQGDGVALYSDRPITVTTPDKYKVTVGADSRTVLGPTYAETYDVGDDVINQIKDGTIATLDQVPNKKLITATLTRRDMTKTNWRTTKFDQAKALSFAFNDSGAFALSSSYAFAAGLKFSNGISAGFDASFGVSAGVSTSFKVDCSKNSIETAYPYGKIKYDTKGDLKGESVTLSVSKVENVVSATLGETFTKVTRLAMAAINVCALAYTARAAAVGNSSSGTSDSETPGVRSFLEDGEKFYLAATIVNAALLAAGVIIGIVQLVSRKTAGATIDQLPATPPTITMNDTGIMIQAGPSFIHIDAAGIRLSGPVLNASGPLINLAAVGIPSTLTPVKQFERAAILRLRPPEDDD